MSVPVGGHCRPLRRGSVAVPGCRFTVFAGVLAVLSRVLTVARTARTVELRFGPVPRCPGALVLVPGVLASCGTVISCVRASVAGCRPLIVAVRCLVAVSRRGIPILARRALILPWFIGTHGLKHDRWPGAPRRRPPPAGQGARAQAQGQPGSRRPSAWRCRGGAGLVRCHRTAGQVRAALLRLRGLAVSPVAGQLAGLRGVGTVDVDGVVVGFQAADAGEVPAAVGGALGEVAECSHPDSADQRAADQGAEPL